MLLPQLGLTRRSANNKFPSCFTSLMTYGVPEVDYNIDSTGRPIVTPRSNSDTAGVQWKYIVQRPQVMSFSGWPEYANVAYDYEHQAIPVGIGDRTWGLVSATNGSKGFTLNQAVVDGLRAVVMS